MKEIRDASVTAFPSLVADMNAIEDIYDSHLGARQGSTSSKEQEAFIWDRTKFSLHSAYDFDDSQNWFERPPTVGYFNVLNAGNAVQKFILISTHIKPKSGVSDMTTEDEINHLQDVYNDAVSREPTFTDAIIAGDMNADCTYVYNPTTDLTLYTDPTSTWLLDFDADTTVKSTDCAYDHIVLKGPNMSTSWSSPAVFDYQTFYDTDNIFYEGDPITELISDHFPVEFTFS